MTGLSRYNIRPEDMPPRLTFEEWAEFCEEMMRLMTPEQIQRQKELEEQIEVPFTL